MSHQSKQYIIFGIGRFGSALAKTLASMGHEVLAVDRDERRVANIAPYVTNAIQMENDEEPMRTLGIRNFDAVVVGIGDDLQHSILVTVMCKEMGAKYLVCKATDAMHAKVLLKLGADKVVFPDRDMGERVAHSLINPHMVDLISLKDDFQISYLKCPPEWVGHSLKEVDVRKHYKVSVLAIYRDDDMIMDLWAETKFDKGDHLLVLGHKRDVERVESMGQ
jgi:trk system potassium uptake protein TrkA